MTGTKATESARSGEVERLATTFDHLDQALDFTTLHQVYGRLRAGCPVSKTSAHNGFALVTHYNDVHEVEKDCQRFSNADGVVHPAHTGRPPSIPVEFDGAEHLAYRKLFMEVLSVPRVRTIVPYLSDLTRRVLDAFAEGDDDDFVQNVAVQIPVRAVGHLLGFGEDANEQLQKFATILLEHAGTPVMVEAIQELDAVALAYCNQRRQNPQTDHLTTLVNFDFGGRLLTDDELVNTIRTFVFAGFETTARAIGSLVAHLAADSELQTRMRLGALSLEGIVEEGLRVYPPVHTMFRTVTMPTELHGTALEEGERLVLLYAAANRDPNQFDDPDSFRPDRANPRQHVAFGVGPHYCAGAALARAEIHILLESLIKRPPLELVGEPRTNPHLMMGQMMGVDYLPVRFQKEH